MNNNNHTVQKLPAIQQKPNSHQSSRTRIIPTQQQNESPTKAYKKKSSMLPQSKKETEFKKLYIRDQNPPNFDKNELNKGLLDLLQKGKIPKSVDLSKMIANDGPLQQKKAKFYEVPLVKPKQEIPIGNQSLGYGIKYDLEFYQRKKEEHKQKNQFKQNSQNYSNITTKSKVTQMKLYNNDFLNKQSDMERVHNMKASIQKTNDEFFENQQQVKVDNQVDYKPNDYQAKEYADVMDAYSLHQFMIRRGKALVETEEFISYKRVFQKQWSSIQNVITALEQFLESNQIKLANIDGKKVYSLALSGGALSDAKLFDCIVNQEDFIQQTHLAKFKYKGQNGQQRAAVKIQSYYKMTSAVLDYRRIKALIVKVKIIQKAIRIFLGYKKTKRVIRDQNENTYKNFQDLNKNFIDMWPQIKYRKRVEIHINSFNLDELKRLSTEKYLQKQNTQINRIFAVKDPNVDVIYISPFDLSTEIMNYYYKILELNNVPNFKERVNFLWPNNHSEFPSHFTVARMLMYSSKTLKRIKRLIKNKEAYLVPGYPSNDDIKLASCLKIPILSGDPQKNLIFSTKSASLRFLNQCEIPVPPGAYELYDEKELLNSLTILISNNLSVKTWLFKIDDESGGRGIASLSIDSIKSLRKIRKTINQEDVDEEIVQIIKESLKQYLHKKLKIATPSLFHSYQEFITHFTIKGGIIEAGAHPDNLSANGFSVFLFIEPDGEIQIYGAYDKIAMRDFKNIACQYPQKSLPNLNTEILGLTVGRKLYQKGVMGYVTMDLVTFPDPNNKNGHPLFWAIGLDCYLNNFSSSYFYFDFLMNGKFDKSSGDYIISQDISLNFNDQMSEKLSYQGDSNDKNCRYFFYCPFLNHPGLIKQQFKQFFSKMRVEGIQFDLEKKKGTTFILLDSLQSGVLSLMTIAQSSTEFIKLMNDGLMFLVNLVGPVALQYFDESDISRSDNINFTDVLGAIRLLHKQTQKQKNSKPTSISSFSNSRMSLR